MKSDRRSLSLNGASPVVSAMTMDASKEAQAGSVAGAPAVGAPVGQPAGAATGSVPQECAGCGKIITERFLLKALDMLWHEDCLKCGCCDCRLGEVGSTLYTKANLILCKRDYLRLFGNTGYCAACNKVIPAFEMVMRARNNVYHLECFACQQCNHRFCVGDRFYLCENKILCEYDYEERLVFANMAYNPPPLAHLKRQTTHLPPPACGSTDIDMCVEDDSTESNIGVKMVSKTNPGMQNHGLMNGHGGSAGAGAPGARPPPGDLNNNMSQQQQQQQQQQQSYPGSHLGPKGSALGLGLSLGAPS